MQVFIVFYPNQLKPSFNNENSFTETCLKIVCVLMQFEFKPQQFDFKVYALKSFQWYEFQTLQYDFNPMLKSSRQCKIIPRLCMVAKVLEKSCQTLDIFMIINPIRRPPAYFDLCLGLGGGGAPQIFLTHNSTIS